MIFHCVIVVSLMMMSSRVCHRSLSDISSQRQGTSSLPLFATLNILLHIRQIGITTADKSLSLRRMLSVTPPYIFRSTKCSLSHCHPFSYWLLRFTIFSCVYSQIFKVFNLFCLSCAGSYVQHFYFSTNLHALHVLGAFYFESLPLLFRLLLHSL